MRAGVLARPGFFINGIFLSGSVRESYFDSVIQDQLSSCQGDAHRFNLEDRGDCQSSRKSCRTPRCVGQIVGWELLIVTSGFILSSMPRGYQERVDTSGGGDLHLAQSLNPGAKTGRAVGVFSIASATSPGIDGE
jgi:hypothetical protein